MTMGTASPAYICAQCAAGFGLEVPEGHRPSAHEGVCATCGRPRMLMCITNYKEATFGELENRK